MMRTEVLMETQKLKRAKLCLLRVACCVTRAGCVLPESRNTQHAARAPLVHNCRC